MKSGLGVAWISKAAPEMKISGELAAFVSEMKISDSRSALQKVQSYASGSTISEPTGETRHSLKCRGEPSQQSETRHSLKGRGEPSQQSDGPGVEINRKPLRRQRRAWPAGEGGKLPSWLHILIRKRE
jgi:hypothetical protein